VPTWYPFLGMTEGTPTIVWAVLNSWTHPLDADIGLALIELDLGIAGERIDMCAEITSPRPEPPRRCQTSWPPPNKTGHGKRTEADPTVPAGPRTQPTPFDGKPGVSH
jgi:hypothetical protein